MASHPPRIHIPRIDWSQHLPGADPYLVWAHLSNFQGYSNGPLQVTVETVDARPPWEASTRELETRYAPTPICPTGIGDGQFWTGTLESGSVLAGMLKRRDIKIELNLARKNLLANNAQGPQTYAKAPQLGASVVAVIDSGCPFAHRQFLERADAGLYSRVRYLWDQDRAESASGSDDAGKKAECWYAVKSFGYGREMTTHGMARLIAQCTNKDGEVDEDQVYTQAQYEVLESRATHGAHVLDLAAGKVNPMTGKQDAASQADIIFVQLPRDTLADTSGRSMTKYVLDALKYIFDKTADVQHLVINLSYGSSAGPHDGSSILERAMDRLIEIEKSAHPNRDLELVLPAGNHFLAQGHGSISLNETKPSGTLYWQVMPDDYTDSFLELWYPKRRAGSIEVRVRSPNGQTKTVTGLDSYTRLKNRAGKLAGAVVHSKETPNGKDVMVLIALGPTHPDSWAKTEHGIWQVQVRLQDRFAVQVHAWEERDDPLPGQGSQRQSYLLSAFLERDIDADDDPADSVKRRTTGNSLANGQRPIVVGVYVAANKQISSYSAAGPTKNADRRAAWPDFLAVGDEADGLLGVLAAGTRSGVCVRMNGTSVAAPQIARALLQKWVNERNYPDTPGRTPIPPSTTQGSIRGARMGSGIWLVYPEVVP